jgi:hypothetical protein
LTQVNANFAAAQHSKIARRSPWRGRIATQQNHRRLGDLYQQLLTARWNGGRGTATVDVDPGGVRTAGGTWAGEPRGAWRHIPVADARDTASGGTAQDRGKTGSVGPRGSLFRFKESAAFLRRIAHQPRGRNVTRVLASPHQAGDLIGFLQTVHSEAEPVLGAVLARAEVAVAADSQPA